MKMSKVAKKLLFFFPKDAKKLLKCNCFFFTGLSLKLIFSRF